ncbi:MAG: DUF1566 domain-containing protein [Myxococcota bacterium]
MKTWGTTGAWLLAFMLARAAHAEAPKRLATEAIDYQPDAASVTKTVRWFRVAAATPRLSSWIGLEVALTSGALRAGTEAGKDLDGCDGETRCEPTLMSDELALWSCHWSGGCAGGGGSLETWSAHAFAIRQGRLVDIGGRRLFKADADVPAKLLALIRSHSPDPMAKDLRLEELAFDGRVEVRMGGVRFHGDGLAGSELADLGWADVMPYLEPPELVRFARQRLSGGDGDAPDAQAVDDPAAFQAWARRLWGDSKDVRFAKTESGTVRDVITGLEWAPADNGSDVTQRDAAAWVAGYRGGGHADWRLPTLAELASLADFGEAHKDKADCFHGHYAMALTPLIAMSCALAWSSDTTAERASAFGCVYYRHYWVRPATKTNYRALAVRGSPDPAWREALAGLQPRALTWRGSVNRTPSKTSRSPRAAATVAEGARAPRQVARQGARRAPLRAPRRGRQALRARWRPRRDRGHAPSRPRARRRGAGRGAERLRRGARQRHVAGTGPA